MIFSETYCSSISVGVQERKEEGEPVKNGYHISQDHKLKTRTESVVGE
jgi:hypothetical protein